MPTMTALGWAFDICSAIAHASSARFCDASENFSSVH
jgi:hypothetical protein